MTTLSRRWRALLLVLTAVSAAAILAMAAPGTATAQKMPQEWDGLARVQHKSLEHVYVRPNVEFKAYKKVRIDPVQVKMDKNWDPNAGKVGLTGGLSSADVQRLRDDLSKTFREVFAERLSKGGYPLVEAVGDDVLQLEPALINVYVTAPSTPSASTRNYVLNAGRMTLVMQLADSVTGQTLARVVDTKEASDTRGVQWANSVTNSIEARRAMGQWADALCKALDTINGKAAGK
jgi:hypothetical protein